MLKGGDIMSNFLWDMAFMLLIIAGCIGVATIVITSAPVLLGAGAIFIFISSFVERLWQNKGGKKDDE